MRSEEEIRSRLSELEEEGMQYEDAYNDNFVAVSSLRWILGMPAPQDLRRYEEQ